MAPSILLILLAGACGGSGTTATVRAYSGAPGPVVAKLDSTGFSGTWLITGRDHVELLYSGYELPTDARVIFLDPNSCAVLGSGGKLPRNARVGLDFVDPGYAVTTNPDSPGDETLVPASRSTLCTN